MKVLVKILLAILAYALILFFVWCAGGCHDVTPAETKDSLPAYWRRDTTYDWWSRLRNSDKHKNAIKDPIE